MNRVLLPLSFTPPAALPAGAQRHTFAGTTMGTTWQVHALFNRTIAAAAIELAIENALQRVIEQMSTWEADSCLSRWNAAPAGTWHTLPDEFFHVLQHALALAEASGSAYDPAVGPLVNAWGFGPEGTRSAPPSQTEINRHLHGMGWQDVQLDSDRKAAFQPGGVYIDLSSIAKGYAVDLVADILQEAGIVSYLVEIGGELKGLGTKTDQQPWWVGLEQPAEDSNLQPAIAGLHALAIATSGDYRKFFQHDAQRYSHTIDPRTGWPVRHDVAAVTVLHPSCMLADGYATALMVLGTEAGLDFANRHRIAARLITRGTGSLDTGSYREHLSEAFLAMLEA